MRILIIYIALIFISCDKEAFLSEKPNKSDVVPKTLEELQAILDQDRDMNGMGLVGRGPVPNLGEIGSDSYYVTDQTYNSVLGKQMQNYYRWSREPYEDVEVVSWRWPYLSVFYANIVLDQLMSIDRTAANSNQYDYLKGSALFYRAHAYYQLAQVFSPPYETGKTHDLPGLPLRENADLNTHNEWVSLEVLYRTIINDLKLGENLMGIQTRSPKTRPSGLAVSALLARVYLTMQDFEHALYYAERVISVGGELLDYNKVKVSAYYPFSATRNTNPEVIFACNMVGNQNLNYPTRDFYALVNTSLLNLYEKNDLRRNIFFSFNSDGTASYRGSYNGDATFFAGITLSEMYLIAAECYARNDQIEESINYLNLLREKRWSEDVGFIALHTSSKQEALELIIKERRKELVFRGLRWTDIRRLNLEGSGIVQRRIINGETIEILPNDVRYIWPLPPEVIAFNNP